MEKRIVFRKSKDVRLVHFKKEDAEILVRFVNDQDVTQFLGTFNPVTLTEEEKWIESLSDSMEKNSVFGIEIEEDKLIGTIGLHNIQLVHGTAWTGTIIGEIELWGQGYGTKAKMLLLDYAFNILGLRSCYSHVYSFNPRSKRYSEKCGYEHIATLPKKIYRGGEYADEWILQVTRENFLMLWKEWKKENL